jgi:peptide/nickel transport system permease protein
LLTYIARRLLQLIPILLIVTFVIFGMLLLLPGDPTIALLGESAGAVEREALRQKLGFDQPVYVQYVQWLWTLLNGDWGRSLRTQELVVDMLVTRIPVTLEVTFLAISISIIIGVPAGIVAALRRNTLIDSAISAIGMAGIAMPHFWAGILLIMLFSLTLRWLPPSGFVPLWVDPIQNLRVMIMPSLMLGFSMSALVMRQTRSSMLDVLSQDYVRTARAKGIAEAVVIVHHALRNALIPVVTVIGLQMGGLVSGAVVTETIFSLPGLGRMIVEGIFERDFAPVQAGILVTVIGVLLVNLATDLTYVLLDKRIKL